MLTGVVAFLLMLVALLAIPLTLTFRVSWQQEFRNDIRLHWAFGLVRVRLSPPQTGAPAPEGEGREQKIKPAGRSPGKQLHVLAAIRQRRFRRRIARYIGAMWRAVHKKDVSLRVRVGLGDPADTGQLWAIVGPVAGLLASVREASISIEPEFIDTTLELDSRGSLRIVPLQMIYLSAALFLSPSFWQGIRRMRRVEQ